MLSLIEPSVLPQCDHRCCQRQAPVGRRPATATSDYQRGARFVPRPRVQTESQPLTHHGEACRRSRVTLRVGRSPSAENAQGLVGGDHQAPLVTAVWLGREVVRLGASPGLDAELEAGSEEAAKPVVGADLDLRQSHLRRVGLRQRWTREVRWAMGFNPRERGRCDRCGSTLCPICSRGPGGLQICGVCHDEAACGEHREAFSVDAAA